VVLQPHIYYYYLSFCPFFFWSWHCLSINLQFYDYCCYTFKLFWK
jgi:hypothetical protein